MTHYLEQPERLQLEISSMCNALCLGCVRTDTNSFSDKKYVIPEKQYISFDNFKKILSDPGFASLKELEFCGTIDDPLMHPEFIEFIDWASTINDYYIIIHTNASLRNAPYWRKLAIALKKNHKHLLKFSIDGLEDTNHIYRQNTTWSKIMENARAFIDEGGNAAWQYLIFPWNAHQVDEAKELSVKMGFKQFIARHDRSIATSLGLEKIQKIKLVNRQGTKTTSIDQVNSSLKDSVKNDISCHNKNYSMYFLAHDSKLWPCCFLHNGFMNTDAGKVEILEKRLLEAYGEDWNDLSKHSVSEVLNHRFYAEDLVASWTQQQHGYGFTDRIHRCTEVCNVKKLEALPIGGHKQL